MNVKQINKVIVFVFELNERETRTLLNACKLLKAVLVTHKPLRTQNEREVFELITLLEDIIGGLLNER